MRARGPLAGIVLVAVLLAGSCSKEPTPGGTDSTEPGPTLPFTAPSADELGEAAGIEFPASMEDYRSVQLDESQLDVTFVLPASDVEAFVDASGLGPLEDGLRTIAHSSPLWGLNPTGRLRGAESVHDDLRRSVEVVDGETADAPVTVRLTIRPA